MTLRRVHELTAGVVGVGFIGTAHIEALRRLGVRVAGCVGSTPERARAKAAMSPLPPVFESLDALCADDSIDVIHIASPNYAHADQVRQVLAAGKHVVCEKPLALTSADCADLLARAAAAGLVHAVCFNIRFYPQCHQAMAMVAAGEIGEPLMVTGHYHQDWLLHETDWNWRLQSEQAGSTRAIADIGSHWFDLMRFITGRRVTDVMAELHTFVNVRVHPEGGVETFAQVAADAVLVREEIASDDAASIMLRLEGGGRAVMSVSQVASGHRNAVLLEVNGSTDSVRWDSEIPDQLWVGHRGRGNETLFRDGSLAHAEAARLIACPPGHVEGFPDTFRALFSQVYADVAAGGPSSTPTYPTFVDGLDAVRVTEAVVRSSHNDRWVPVDRT